MHCALSAVQRDQAILVAGGGIGGLAAALALAKAGKEVKVLEQSAEIGEIGAGMQLGPNAFHAFDLLGVGPIARKRAVFTDYLVMHDALDGYQVAKIPTGDAFMSRFGNPYAVIHRVDAHNSLLEAAMQVPSISFHTSVRVCSISQDEQQVCVEDQMGNKYTGAALIGADGIKSIVREQFVGDPARVTGHVVYRAVVDREAFPADLRWNAAAIWVGPKCHLVHYPLRGGEQYNLVVTFHSRHEEQWGVRDGSADEVQSYFHSVIPQARQLIDLPKSWKRWATADRDPIEQWSFGLVTLLGDAAHPTTQYMAQGACMALEDAVTLGQCVQGAPGDLKLAFERYQKARIARTARIVLSAREMGRIYHAEGVERLVRNDLWRGLSMEGFY
ncbi:MAG: 3-hydroxybenzoate 6-monooxygenase, partial [Betaproteobacteria bacterium]|nr:3-hydroxybenzoate 6-monooxygenase [Betaproteobacteria bacterium]